MEQEKVLNYQEIEGAEEGEEVIYALPLEACGRPLEEGYDNTEENYFGLIFQGDSMKPRILDGDIIIVNPKRTCEQGKLAVVWAEGERYELGYFHQTPEGMFLLTTSQNYKPIFYTNEQIEALPVEIIGQVVEVRGKI